MSKEDELLEGVNMEQDIKILEEFCGALAEQYLDQIVCDESELYQAIKNIIKAYKELEEENKNYKIIKMIELLNMIANGEEIPRHIKYNYYKYDWSDNANDYICEDADGERLSLFDDGYICILCNSLNNEVEILEDNTEEIEELLTIEDYESDKTDIRLNRDKINELVRAVNELRKEKSNE